MELITQLAQNGLLALLLAISLLAIIVQYRENRELYKTNNDLQEKRLLDAIQVRDTVLSPLKELQSTVSKILTLVEAERRNH